MRDRLNVIPEAQWRDSQVLKTWAVYRRRIKGPELYPSPSLAQVVSGVLV